MTIEELEGRLATIDANMKQIVANYNMLEGGRQEIMHWIAQLKEKTGNGTVME